MTVSEGTDVQVTVLFVVTSTFLTQIFIFQPEVCNGCHDLV